MMANMVSQRVDIPGIIKLDLSIQESQLQQGALLILERVRPNWKIEDITFKVFTSGITNKLIGCYLKDDCHMEDCVLVRIYGEKTELLIDRNLELVTLYVLHMAKFSPPVYCQFNNGIAYGFVPGCCVDTETVRQPDIGKLVAEEMIHLHAVDPSKYSSGLSSDGLSILSRLCDREPFIFKRLRQFLDIVPESFPDPERNKWYHASIPALSELRKEAEDLERELHQLDSPIVFGHNDLLLNNIVYNESKGCCHFIDFEYAGFNYLAYDIANHFCEWAGVDEVDYERYPDKPTQMRWLRHFLEAYKKKQDPLADPPTAGELEKLYVQVNKLSLASNLFWGVWALVQARYSTIDFDFLGYSKLRLDQYFKTKELFLSLKLPQ